MSKLVFMVLLLVVIDYSFGSKVEPIQHVQVQDGSLQKDLNEFLNIIPVDDIRNLTKFFYANDEAMRDSYEYLRDEGIKLIVENLSTLSLVKKFTTFLNDTGVNFAELEKRVEGIVLTREDTRSIVVNEDPQDDMGGMNAFFSEALSLIPQDEILSLFFLKMEESADFSSFLEKLNPSDYENLAENLKRSQGLQAIYFEFHAHGIDIMEWAKALKSFLGY